MPGAGKHTHDTKNKQNILINICPATYQMSNVYVSTYVSRKGEFRKRTGCPKIYPPCVKYFLG